MSGDAFTGSTSELRWKGTDPQQDRGGFKQVKTSLVVEDALANGIETTKTTPTRKDLLDEQDRPTITLPCYLYDFLFGSRPKAYMAGQEDKNIRPVKDKSNICTDTEASICVTGSLENTTNVVEKLVRVEMAGREWNVDESHTRLHEDILLEEQIWRSGFDDSACALREVCQPGFTERESMQ